MKSAAITEFLDVITRPEEGFTFTRTEALQHGLCCVCGGAASTFRDALSKKEYGISAMCQACQDDYFND